MTCWRCGVSLEPLGYHEDTDEYEMPAHKPWCSMPGGCSHCGWSPCRWWCIEAERSVVLNFDMPPSRDSVAYHRERNRRIAAGTWIWSAA